MRTYSLNIRPEYLTMILDGRKTIEVRVAYPRFAEVTSGDTLRFNGRHEYSIAKVARHSNFDALLEAEDAERIYPSDPGKLLEVLREIYPPEKEALGVLAIHVRPDAAVGDE
jgi:ASC-1-like (ASCH) protein